MVRSLKNAKKLKRKNKVVCIITSACVKNLSIFMYLGAYVMEEFVVCRAQRKQREVRLNPFLQLLPR